jgi:7-carboxy-7-deazaguanine synthase
MVKIISIFTILSSIQHSAFTKPLLDFMSTITTTTLPVMEAFYTLQGEGFHQGRAAYFIRLGGCDVGCFWCDVKDSWDASKHPQLSIDQIVSEAKKFPGRLAVITGGEPLLHDLDALTNQLHEAGFETNIETSGSSPVSGIGTGSVYHPKNSKHRFLRSFLLRMN